MYVETLRAQVEAQAKYIEEIRKVKHDMYAHLMVVHHYLNSQEYGKAKDYLSKLMSVSIFQQSSSVDVGNDLVNTLLVQRVGASKEEIILSTSGLLPEVMWIDDMDLCILFSNLISNSVEACEKLAYKEKIINLTIEDKPKQLSIYIENPVEREMNVGEFEGHTTKEDCINHGYGLRNIKRIVEKYHGEMSMQCINGLVSVKIDLPCVAQDTAL